MLHHRYPISSAVAVLHYRIFVMKKRQVIYSLKQESITIDLKLMNNENSEKPVLNNTASQAVKKIYHAPSVKLYGSINELVQNLGPAGVDSGINDDGSGSN